MERFMATTRLKSLKRTLPLILLSVAAAGCGEETAGIEDSGIPVLIVVSPHPDDETIMAGGTLYRAAQDGRTRIEVIYVTAGDAAGMRGPCREESETEKKRKIMELREDETRAACGVLGIPSSRLHFLRYPDHGLVAKSTYSEGRRLDVLTEDGERAVAQVAGLLPGLVPRNAASLLVITASFWDAHGDHRGAYQAARAAAEVVRSQRDIPVRLMHAIVHDEIPLPFPICCPGDLFWPNDGPHLDHERLSDFPARPRPPPWDVVQDVGDLVAVRVEALNEHESQVKGNPGLCMFVYLKSYYQAWMEKTEEAFWEEIL
jgi:LmbE family N-acetylglucosaminyl deacetylase